MLGTGMATHAQGGFAISGHVSLPNGDTAPAGGLEVALWIYDIQDTGFTDYGGVVSIPAGASDAPYSFTVPADPDHRWGIDYSCDDCPYAEPGRYRTSGTVTLHYQGTALPGGMSHSDVDVELLSSNRISGRISLPAGETAPASGYTLWPAAMDSKRQLLPLYDTADPTILVQGESSADYEIFVPAEFDNTWVVGFICFSGCEPFHPEGYLGPVGMLSNPYAARPFASGQDHSNVDLTVMDRVTVSGTVRVADGSPLPAGGLGYSISGFEETDPADYLPHIPNADAETSLNAAGIAYPFSLTLPAEPGNFRRLRLDCLGDCGDFASRYFHHPAGAVWDSDGAALLPADSDVSGLEIVLLPGTGISGEMSMAAPVLPGGYISRIGAVGSDGSGPYYSTALDFVADGNPQAYTLAVPDRSGVDWQVYYQCTYCTGHVRKGFYSSGGTRFTPGEATWLSGAMSHSGIDLDIPAGVELSGDVGYPSGFHSPIGGTDVTLFAADPVSGDPVFEAMAFLFAGTTDTGYTLIVPDEAEQSWHIGYHCPLCEGYLPVGYHAGSATTPERAGADVIPGGAAATGLDLTFLLAGNSDGDSIPDYVDNCRDTDNEDQADTDGDGVGDACDPDSDNDGVPDAMDMAPGDPTVCLDADLDGCDDCALGNDGFGPLPDNDPESDGIDRDRDGICSTTDTDDDGDGIEDVVDNCPFIANPGQDPGACGGPWRDLCIPVNPGSRRFSLVCPAALLPDHGP